MPLQAGTLRQTHPPCCFYSGYSFQEYYGDLLDNEDNNYTVFVPTTEAVEEVAALMNLNLFDLAGFSDMSDALGYHIVPGTYTAADLEDGMALTTLQGQSLDVNIDGTNVGNDGAWVVEANIMADNGVIHVIDATLAPEGYPQATVVTAIAGSPDHTLFEEGIFNAYLDGYLSANALEAEDDNNGDPTTGPYTVFAPTDAAMAAFARLLWIQCGRFRRFTVHRRVRGTARGHRLLQQWRSPLTGNPCLP